MEEKKYNGWKNYETWAVVLWLENEQASAEYWREQAEEHCRTAPRCRQVLQGYWSAEEAATFNLADQIKEELENASPLPDAGLFTDLLNAALWEVDWQEVAESFLEEFKPFNTEPQAEEVTNEDEQELCTLEKQTAE
jgi:hypothetical protein